MGGRIHVIHENAEWLPPLRAAFEARGLPYAEWHLAAGAVDLDAAPPEGVFYNRMSASSFTRGHDHAPELTAAVLGWLEGHGRRVVNDSRALRLEVSKAAQYAALKAAGVPTPRTIAAVGREAVIREAGALGDGPVILKPNRGGKGAGVELFDSPAALIRHVESDAYAAPVDGVHLIQEYIESADPRIIRAEFIGGRFFYAVRVDTSDGFELCPADVCAVPGAAPVRPKFEIIQGFDHPILERFAAFLAVNGVEVVGIEFITDRAGDVYAYDVNTNTNYNPEAEAAAGLYGMDRLAAFLGETLDGQALRAA